tara:strand:- start:399 stop:647 length:249 start_codon:yes stop_codon:yes gene_type:complete
MRIGLKQRSFNKALVQTFPSLSQREFCEEFNISYHYLSNLKSEKIKERKYHSAGPNFRKKLLATFNGKYSFSDLFYEVDDES